MIAWLTTSFPLEVAFDLRPPGPHLPADQWIEMRASVPAPAGLPDLELASTSPEVRCVVEGGFAFVVVEATRATWPEEWPEQVSCSWGPLSLPVTLRDCGAACARRDRDASLPLPRCDTEGWLPQRSILRGLFTEGCTLSPELVTTSAPRETWPARTATGPVVAAAAPAPPASP